MSVFKTMHITLWIMLLLSGCASFAEPEDGRILYMAQDSASTISMDTGRSETIAEGLFPEGWSPSGEQILLRGTDGIYVYDETIDEPVRILALSDHPEWSIQQLTWLGEDVVLIVVEKASGTFLHAIKPLDGWNLEMWPDLECRDVLASPDGTLWLQRTAEGVEVASLTGSRTTIQDIWYGISPYVRTDTVFSPDGSRLAYLFEDMIWTAQISMDGLQNRKALAEAEGFTPDLTWSPDGRYIAFQAYDFEKNVNQLRILDADTGSLEQIQTWPGTVSQLMWSPRSDSVMSFSGAPFVMDIGSGEISYPFGETAYDVVTVMDWR